MTEPMCEDEGLLQEWSPLTQLLQHIPLKIQKGLFSQNLNLTCIDVVSEYMALGTNLSLVYWYSRADGELQRLRLENSQSAVTCVKIVSTVDYMVAAGTSQGTVTVFQIPKLVPATIPEQLKPKKKQIERFTITGLHTAPITNIEWSQNGMKLFSGDKHGVVALTEIDFSMHLTKSIELLNEHFEIIQLSYNQQILLISTVYRSILCDGTKNWKVSQVGTKERKILGKFGATFCKFDHGVVLYASRPGYRLWLSDRQGVVQQTLIFKAAVQSTCPKIQLINPVNKKEPFESSFGKVLQFGDNKLITYNSDVLYVLHPGAVSVVSILHNARKILDLSVNENEIFILEGERSLLRISPVPDKYSLEMLYRPISRKSSFNLDEFAAKIKDTAVGSIKKITKDLITLPEQTSPNSPPAVADEALELPPVVQLPDGSVPSIFPETVEVHSSYENSPWTPDRLTADCSVSGDKASGTTFVNDCHEEVISRPLRKKHAKKSKTLPNVSVVESESDTTSTASDDRMTWGVVNDMSLSDESAATSHSVSSFSVLRDISSLVNQSRGFDGVRSRVRDESAVSDDKSQASLDTCESVSENLPASDRFREEQERIFARLANKSLLDSFNSERTDNMSVSFNMTTSSSVSSKISGNLASPSEEYSENSSMVSGEKTTESNTYDNYSDRQSQSERLRNVSYSPSEPNCPDDTTPFSQDDRNTESVESLESSGNSQRDQQSGDTGGSTDQRSDTRKDSSSKRISYVENPDDKQRSGNQYLDNNVDEDEDGENCRIDFGISSLSEFFSKEHLEALTASEKYSLASELFDADRNANGRGENVTHKCDATTSSANVDALSYGPPSGSSLLCSQPPSDYPSMASTEGLLSPKQQIRDFSDNWLQHKTPDSIACLAVSQDHVLCTDVNDSVYYSSLSGVALAWVLTDYKATAVRASNDGSVVWLLNKKSVYSLTNPTQSLVSRSLEEVASNVLSFAVDNIDNDGWIVGLNGRLTRYPYSLGSDFRDQEEVPCGHSLVDVVCSGGTVVVLTERQSLLGKKRHETEFRLIETEGRTVSSLSMGPQNLLWIVDDKNTIYFSDDYLSEATHWWEVQITDYVFQSPPVTFQNIYSKIKLNNLKGNANTRTTQVAANESSVWVYDKSASVLRLNKSDFTGYRWDKVNLKRSVTNVHWQSLCAEGVFEDKGHVWLLSTDGNIFCIAPGTDYFQSISVPCDDNVICLASSTDTLWVLSERGGVYSRLGLSGGNFLGNSWRELKLPQIDNLRLIWVSCGCDVAWGCDAFGRTFITIGSPHHMATNIFDAAWLEVEGRPKGVQFEKVFVGPQLYMVWAIDVKGVLYVREGIFSHYQIGTSWVCVSGIEAVHVSISGSSVWALARDGRIYRRCGISEKNYIGDYWKNIPGTYKMITSSFTDDLWGVTHDNKIMRLNYKVKVLGGSTTGRDVHTAKEDDVSWEVLE